MVNKKLLSLGCALTVLMLISMTNVSAVTNAYVLAPMWPSEFRPHGAYADEITFQVYEEGEIPLAMLALQNGDFESYDDRILSSYMGPLIHDPNIEVTFTLGVRYRTLNLNCERFPTNITAYRRAMAYGFDKYRANQEAIGGIGMPLDSYIPIVSETWEVESEVGGEFYDMNIEAGNASLEAAGFIDLDGDGWREYDANGDGDFVDPGDYDDDAPEMSIEMNPSLAYDPAIIACTVAQDGLEAMGMHSTIVEMDFGTIIDNMVIGDYYVSCWTEGVSVLNTAKLLYDNFRTGAVWNPDYYHFSNATIDVALDAMVAGTTLEEVQAGALEASRLLAYEQPQIVCYNDAIVGAYRVGDTTEWTGYFEVPGLGVTHGDNSHLCTKIHHKDGSLGGEFVTALSDNMNTLNCQLQTTGYEATVFQYIYESLWQVDPVNWQPMPMLAYAWETEVGITEAAYNVTNGEKYTFYLYENETWHDGEAFTAADVKFSFEEVWPYSNAYPTEAEDIYKILTPDDYTVEIYVNNTGFFQWTDVTGMGYIVPEHIWDGVNVTTFNPTDAQMIGTGPYAWNERVPGQYINLVRHADWRWDIRDIPPPPEPDTTTTTTTTTTEPDEEDTSFSVVSIIAGLGFVVAIYYKRRR